MQGFNKARRFMTMLLAGIGLTTVCFSPAAGFEYKSEKHLSKAAVFAKTAWWPLRILSPPAWACRFWNRAATPLMRPWPRL